jgi:hypothetical protein
MQRGAALHVGDLAVAEGDHLEALCMAPVSGNPAGCTDDLVLRDLHELRLHLDPLVAALVNLELQDLTGLVRPASRWCVLPPETTVRDAPPLRIFGEERRERLRIAMIERLDRDA